MKKSLFIMIFVSAISLFGISKASALPIGSVFENWETNKVFLGQFYNNTGALMPFYGYNGTGSMSCPYLDTTNELSMLNCYNDKQYRGPGKGSSYLVNSYPLCTSGACDATPSVINLVYLLRQSDNELQDSTLYAGNTYHVELDFGIKEESDMSLFADLLDTAYNFQNGDADVDNIFIDCYEASDTENVYQRNYCSLSYDLTPTIDSPQIFIDFSGDWQMVELNYSIEWMLYPLITQDISLNLDKYTMKSNQYAFISGITSGSVYLPEKYWYSDKSYLNYYDINRDSQPYSSYINDVYFTEFLDYMYYNFELAKYPGAELVMLSTNAWSTSNYPFKDIEFYVPKGTYVDIVDLVPVSNIGNTLTFKYKNPSTGLIEDISVNSFSLDSNSATLFGNLIAGLNYFQSSILNVGTMFSSFFNSLNSPLAWFIIIGFSFCVLIVIIKLFM